MSERSLSRRQAYAEESRAAILSSAHRLFTKQGFSGTSIDAIAADAKLTKGAVYHHFKDKKAVFAACFEQQARSVSEAIANSERASGGNAGLWQQAENACLAFLRFVVSEGRNTIPLQEVITVLGWEQWRAIDTRHTMGYIEDLVQQMLDEGLLKAYPAQYLSSMVYSILVDAAMNLGANASSSNEDVYTRLVMDVLRGLEADR